MNSWCAISPNASILSMDKARVILLKDYFGGVEGAVICGEDCAEKIRQAFELAAKKHATSDAEGGDHIRSMLEYIPQPLKEKIYAIVTGSGVKEASV